MFRVYEFTDFGTPSPPAAPQLPSAALAGAPWARITDDPFFAEIDLHRDGLSLRS